MCYVDQQGLYNVLPTVNQFAADPLGATAFWLPAPLLARLAAVGMSFAPGFQRGMTRWSS